ncbi:synembryn-A-like [Oppia nitens]|uniref:synembryn-A-like n=1 Tax=Oppia nitens TaxID=1686743 RepID=UPI0023DA3EFA|nr:synembryn-A-like [Oppia nitens]
MDELIKVVKTGNKNDISVKIQQFLNQYGKLFTIDDTIQHKKQLTECLFRLLRDPEYVELHSHCLEVMRILTRDKQHCGDLFSADRIETMLHLAMLVGEEEAFMTLQNTRFDTRVVVEAQMCLCNLIYNCSTIQKLCANNSCIEGIMLRLRMHPDPQLPQDVKYYDMRMLFLISALCAEVRPRIRDDYHGLIYLMETIDLILKNNSESQAQVPNKNKRRSKGSRRGKKGAPNDTTEDECLVAYYLDNWEVDFANEVLKSLFNLTINIDKNHLDEIEEAHFLRLVSILHDLLLCDTKSKDKKEDLQSHTVNLLTSMPANSFEELLSPITEMGRPDNPDHEYDEMNMEVIAVLVQFLSKRLDNHTVQNSRERLAPILTCLSEASRANPTIRKYLRSKVLPPLKDARERPEEGTTLRNRLVRLMTSPHTEVKELVADFLFVLCKENVCRLIKYTGYGNAAGLLANRGLMLGGCGNSGNYSSESEESDTEEYAQMKDKINPVTGCYEEPKPDPMAGMTTEQKEYEAIRLVEMIDKLAKTGVVKPCRVGDDGKPHPVEHILELQQMAAECKRKDSKSDD